MAKKKPKKDEKRDLTPKVAFDSSALAKRIKKAENKSVTHAHKFIVRRWTNMGEVRRHVISWMLLVGFLILMVGVQLVWYRNSFSTVAPQDNTVFVEGALGPVQTLNPLFATTSAEQALGKLIFSQPMQYDTSGNLGYDLLSNLEIDETEKVYTLTVRDDAVWHDGLHVTADDIIFTIDLLKNPAIKTGSLKVWSSIETKKINEQTVQLTLAAPYAPFKHYLAFSVLPEHLLKDVDPALLRENQFNNQPIGSGPFKFKFIQDGDINGASKQAVHLVRNDDYYSGAARLSRFQMLVYDTQEALLSALKHNEVNGLADLSPTELSKVDANKYNVRSMPTKGGVYLLFNTTAANLDDVKMRQAIRSGVDTEKIRKSVGGDFLKDLFLPTHIDETDLVKPKYDSDMTKVYLDELGWRKTEGGSWKKGDEELRLKIAVIKGTELEAVADQVGSQLNDLGVKTDTQILDLENVDQAALQNTLQPREFDILINRINIGADPDVYAYWHSSQANKNGLNFSNYKDPVADDALTSALSKRSVDLRNAKYKTFVTRWLKDVPAIGLYQTSASYVSLKSARSFADDLVFVSPITRYSDVLYWSAGNQSVYRTP